MTYRFLSNLGDLMKSILAISLAPPLLLCLAACETSLTPAAKQTSPETLEVDATSILAAQPASALSSSEAEVASVQPAESPAAPIETAAGRFETPGAAVETAAAQIEPVDLSGNWLLTLPAGYQYRATIEALEDGRYRLQTIGSFRGVYQLNGDVLQVVEPSDERLNVFDWQLHNGNSMTLVDETGASGARYAGATMGRQIESDAELPRQISAIGRPAVPRPPSTTRPSTAICATR